MPRGSCTETSYGRARVSSSPSKVGCHAGRAGGGCHAQPRALRSQISARGVSMAPCHPGEAIIPMASWSSDPTPLALRGAYMRTHACTRAHACVHTHAHMHMCMHGCHVRTPQGKGMSVRESSGSSSLRCARRVGRSGRPSRKRSRHPNQRRSVGDAEPT